MAVLIEENRGTKVTIDGQPFTYFGGTNYLSMAHRQELIDAGIEAFKTYGFSCSASRLTSGENDLLLELERELAAFADFEAAVALPAGFMSNLAVVDALDERVDGWLIQPYAHGSIRSALATSDKPCFTLGVNETEDYAGLRLGIFAEPINPMTGELTNVPELFECAVPRSYIVLDEAHSFGVLGDHGSGATEHFRISNKAYVISTGTFSKAIGAYGGFVVATSEIVEAIKEKSASYRGSTPLTPVATAAVLASLRFIRANHAATIEALRKNVSTINIRLQNCGVEKDSPVPIFYILNPLDLPDLEEKLRANGLFVPPVGSYFTAACDLACRWTVQAAHSSEEIDALLTILDPHIR